MESRKLRMVYACELLCVNYSPVEMCILRITLALEYCLAVASQ